MSVEASAWCIIGNCPQPPEIVLTYERHGIMAHYGACREHVHHVADRVLYDLARIDATRTSGMSSGDGAEVTAPRQLRPSTPPVA